MAPRKNYKIYIDGEHVDTRHSWNAARRAIPKLIKNQCLGVGQVARLINSNYRHSVDGDLVAGAEHWETSDGRNVYASIEKVINHEQA